jgi:hypothetical protein
MSPYLKKKKPHHRKRAGGVAHKKIIKDGWAQWLTPVILAEQKASKPSCQQISQAWWCVPVIIASQA